MTLDKFLKEFDVQRDKFGRSYHIKSKQSELNGYVMTCGSRERVLKAKELVDEPKLVSDNRGIPVLNGFYKTTPVTIFCSGMGPSSTEISFTEILFNIDLSKFKRPTIIRAGTAGSWHPKVDLNSYVIETGVVRNEGTSGKIAPIEWPAVTDMITNLVICETAIKMGLSDRIRLGIGICKDTLYADEDPGKRSALVTEVGLKQKEYEALGAVSTSMESAPFSILTDYYNKKLFEYRLNIRISFSCILLIVSPYYAQTSGVEFKTSEKAEMELVELTLKSLERKSQLDEMYLEGKKGLSLDMDSILGLLYKSSS